MLKEVCFKNYLRILIVILLGGFQLFETMADSVDDYEKAQEEELKKYKNEQDDIKVKQLEDVKKYKKKSSLKFTTWKKERVLEYNQFKDKIIQNWGEFIEPTNKKWVEYSKDGKAVSFVDFDKGFVQVEVLTPHNASEEKVIQATGDAIKRVVTSKGSNSNIPVQSEKKIQEKPLLHNQVVNQNGEVVTEKNVLVFVKSLEKSIKVETAKKYKKCIIRFELVSDHLQKRMEPYIPIINKYCNKYSLNKARVLATIECESSFNPMAFSGTGAIGLMQLMPQYGGKEAYQFLFKTDMNPEVSFLYEPENNIHLGCVYIYLLNNKHLNGIVDRESLMYCSIASYNTGPSNTARAFVSNRDIRNAINIVNRNNTFWVYQKLIKDLPYKETREYLPKVTKSMKKYQ